MDADAIRGAPGGAEAALDRDAGPGGGRVLAGSSPTPVEPRIHRCRPSIASSGSRSSRCSRWDGSGAWRPSSPVGARATRSGSGSRRRRSRPGQAILGTILLLTGHRVQADDVLGGTLHYIYGYLPLLLFVFAHVIARAGNARMIGIDRPIQPWVPFAWASFICFGLTLRALMTGLGM